MDIHVHLASLPDLNRILPLVRAYHAFEHLSSGELGRETAVQKLLTNPTWGGIWLISCDGRLAGQRCGSETL